VGQGQAGILHRHQRPVPMSPPRSACAGTHSESPAVGSLVCKKRHVTGSVRRRRYHCQKCQRESMPIVGQRDRGSRAHREALFECQRHVPEIYSGNRGIVPECLEDAALCKTHEAEYSVPPRQSYREPAAAGQGMLTGVKAAGGGRAMLRVRSQVCKAAVAAPTRAMRVIDMPTCFGEIFSFLLPFYSRRRQVRTKCVQAMSWLNRGLPARFVRQVVLRFAFDTGRQQRRSVAARPSRGETPASDRTKAR